jgi:D-amino-acid dehydrogenase
MTEASMPASWPGTAGHVTIVGAGIIGVCSANYLLRAGFSVDVLDPVIPGSPDQCSYGNAGGISPGSCIPNAMPGMAKNIPGWLADSEGPISLRLLHLPHALPWLIRFLAAGRRSRVPAIADAMRALHRYTFEAYEPLLKDAGCEELLLKRGQLFAYEDPKGLAKSGYSLELRRERGVAVEILNADELRQLEPALGPQFKAGVYLPEQGQTPNPGRLVERLAALAASQGARFIRTKVRALEMGARGPVAALTDGGRRPVELLVVAAGAFSGPFASTLGLRIPLESERGYHVTISSARTSLRIQTVSAEHKFVAAPHEGGLRLSGTVEFAGLTAKPDPNRARILLSQGRRMFPGLDTSTYTSWMGNRPGTPDSIPVIERLARYPNVVVAFGHGHQGMIGGAVTGRLVAQLTAGEVPGIDLTPYRSGRF